MTIKPSDIPTAVLVTKFNFKEVAEKIKEEMKNASIVGIDLETHDVDAHAGIKELRKEEDDGAKKVGKSKHIIDMRRAVITGISLWPDNADQSYYFNVAHADEENRIPVEDIIELLDSKPDDVAWVAHNAPFEISMTRQVWNYKLTNIICTLQMAVSAYSPDEYDHIVFQQTRLEALAPLVPDIRAAFSAPLPDFNEEEENSENVNRKFTRVQQDIITKIISKSSNAKTSYKGLVEDITYGYGLKAAVKAFFNHDMPTYQETLGDKYHMGQLTSAETAEYGASDAFWAVKLFFHLYGMMESNCPTAIDTFFEQENPMVHIYSDIRCEGFRINRQAIEDRREIERKEFAQLLRDMKAAIRDLLPFNNELQQRLATYDKWYREKGQTYRNRLIDWAKSPDSKDDFKQACQVSNAVSNAWAGNKNPGLSINHYYQTRIMMYDLVDIPAIVYKGKVSSDGECRGEVLEKLNALDASDPTKENKIKLIQIMSKISSIEQRMKLYLTPYLLMQDPETGRVYPEVSSMLATRRMACMNPNGMQLAKRGESVYVRGFYKPDQEDHVLVSLDWSQVELVLIGEFSGDPEFKKAFGQLPYQDLHLGAAADVLSVVIPEVTADLLKAMNKMDASQLPPKLLVKPNGEPLDPAAAKKYWRTEVGKGSNFNYWYSGALSTVGEKMGWTSDQMWKATEKYRERFAVAEQWRVDLIESARDNGFIILPDGHYRYLFESTYEWAAMMQQMLRGLLGNAECYHKFINEVIRAIRTRAGNQMVNTMIQGSSATLAKRSIIGIDKKLKETGIDAKFKLPVHDELVYSVNRQQVPEFITLAKGVMKDHPSIVKNLKLDCTASVGLTFEPFHDKKAPLGQIELDECPELFGFGADARLTNAQIPVIVEYLFDRAKELNYEL